MSKAENVLVFPRNLLDQVGTFQGLNFASRPYVDAILSPRSVRFVPRQVAESDETTKQIIPYIILIHEKTVLFYVRGKESGETRLISKGSIGFGGHIRPEDDSLFHKTATFVPQIYHAAVEREVHEELRIDAHYIDQIVAVLNDDTDSVGRVHFGIVHVWQLDAPTVSKQERQITKLSFLELQEIAQQGVELERWSQICLDQIEKIMAAVR